MAVLGLMLGAVGLTAFWVPEIWNYGYSQVIAGQLSALVFGASLVLHFNRRSS